MLVCPIALWKNHFITLNIPPLEVLSFGTTQKLCRPVIVFAMVAQSTISRHPIYVVSSLLVMMLVTVISILPITLVVTSLLKMKNYLLTNTNSRTRISMITYWEVHLLLTLVMPCLTT